MNNCGIRFADKYKKVRSSKLGMDFVFMGRGEIAAARKAYRKAVSR